MRPVGRLFFPLELAVGVFFTVATLRCGDHEPGDPEESVSAGVFRRQRPAKSRLYVQVDGSGGP
jgi:hypothetical protein